MAEYEKLIRKNLLKIIATFSDAGTLKLSDEKYEHYQKTLQEWRNKWDRTITRLQDPGQAIDF